MNNSKYMADNHHFALTREYLYKLIVDNFAIVEKYLLLKHNKQMIIEVFNDSASIAKVIENVVVDKTDLSFSSFDDLWKKILKTIDNEDFMETIDSAIRKRVHNKLKGNSRDTYKMIAVAIFKEMSLYHNKIIEKCFASPWFTASEHYNANQIPQTFLSYAYIDKAISLGLFLYFLINGGFLYVNWMWSGVNPAQITKYQLDCELDKSSQFLFLRTLNSELEYHGNAHVRQWCSWEIGNYYTKNKNGKFYLNFYGNGNSNNDLLSTFSVFSYVRKGIING